MPPVARPSKPAVLPREVPPTEPQKPDSPKPDPTTQRSRTSSSQVSWAERMKRTLGINVLQCPVCRATMTLLAVITKPDGILKILSHLNVPRYALKADGPCVAYYDMSGEPIVVRIVVKPTPSIGLAQQTLDAHSQPQSIRSVGVMIRASVLALFRSLRPWWRLCCAMHTCGSESSRLQAHDLLSGSRLGCGVPLRSGTMCGSGIPNGIGALHRRARRIGHGVRLLTQPRFL
jgi:hypothetical protein